MERRRLLCAILFHFVAAICVIWSLFVLIDRAAEEVQKGLIGEYCSFSLNLTAIVKDRWKTAVISYSLVLLQ